jgi:hypothetical protein
MLERILIVCIAALSTGCATTAGQQPTARQLERARGFDWVVDTTEHFILHVQGGSPAAARKDLLGFQLDRARERTLQILNQQDFPDRIDVFAVSSRERMDDLVGRSVDGMAYHRSKVITLVLGDSISGSPAHEVFHVIVMNVWGLGPTWLNEGMSVDAAGSWRGRDVHAVARELRARDQLAPIERLTRDFRALAPQVAYPQAGSLVRYIRERYNPESLHALWNGDDVEFARLAGIDLAALDDLWRDWLAR